MGTQEGRGLKQPVEPDFATFSSKFQVQKFFYKNFPTKSREKFLRKNYTMREGHPHPQLRTMENGKLAGELAVFFQIVKIRLARIFFFLWSSPDTTAASSMTGESPATCTVEPEPSRPAPPRNPLTYTQRCATIKKPSERAVANGATRGG